MIEPELILDLIAEQSPALILVDGVVYEARLEACLAGELTAIARLCGTRGEYETRRWQLSEIAELGRVDVEPADMDETCEDPLLGVARGLAATSEMSLAEQLLHKHTNQRGAGE